MPHRKLRHAALRPRAGGPATALFLGGLALSGFTALGMDWIEPATAQTAGGTVERPAAARADRRVDDPAAAAMPTGTGSVRDVPRGDGTGRPSQSRIDNAAPAPAR